MSTEGPISDEVYWQGQWDKSRVFETEISGDKPPFYCLEMYPYPSGKMHMGHVRNYSIGDAVARYKRMSGFDVLYPIGYDSFGMPAENAAIKEGGHPHDITEKNMNSITQQIKRMGFSYDWRRMIKSHDPKYYKWNQYFFTKFFENGLAVQKFAPVNWCNSCSTVLANEQVKAGRCWRCNGPVKQKDMSQWFLNITDYTQELLDGLEQIDFPSNVKLLQQDWLGRSEGCEIRFEIENFEQDIEVFTTRPDTLFGVTFVTLAPEHPLAEILVKDTEFESAWKELFDETSVMSEFDRIKNLGAKKGVPTGRFAIHPLTQERIPIWIGNFVIASYGTGAVMAVPGHDDRDFEFANRYDIEIKRVLIMKENQDPGAEVKKAETELGWMVNSPMPGFDGLYGEEAKSAISDKLQQIGMGKSIVQWKIRPWLISRQRYWGTPIPIIHCDDCGPVAVPEDQLPVELPRDVEFTGKGNPLETSESFLNVDCPKCGKPSRRETDTMDTFVDSSWYFLRYTDAMNHEMCFDKDIANHWMNVDFYCGGIEHAQMHLIYARFWTKALRDLGLHDIDEPFQSLLCQGMVNKAAPWCEPCGVTLPVEHIDKNCPHCDSPLSLRSAKMSKSLGNTVSPEDMVDNFGADTVRLFILFAANPTAGMDWSDKALQANYKVMQQMEKIPDNVLGWGNEENVMDNWLLARLNQRIRDWKTAMDEYDLRRAVELSHYELPKDINWYVRRGGNNASIGSKVLKSWSFMIALATPHLAEDWWKQIGQTGLLANQVMDDILELNESEKAMLDSEELLKSFLENARKVKSIAERHLDGSAQHAKIVVSPAWKRELAKMALSHIISGGNPKQFIGILGESELVNDENKGQVMGFWSKRMLPQVFKWDDDTREIILSQLSELSVFMDRTDFISQELGLSSVEVILAESPEDDTGKAGAAMPLSPAIVYS